MGCRMNVVLCGKSLQSRPTICDPMDLARQASLSVGFCRQEYWSGLPFPSAGIFPTQGSNLLLLHWQVDSLPLGHLGSLLSSSRRVFVYTEHLFRGVATFVTYLT